MSIVLKVNPSHPFNLSGRFFCTIISRVLSFFSLSTLRTIILTTIRSVGLITFEIVRVLLSILCLLLLSHTPFSFHLFFLRHALTKLLLGLVLAHFFVQVLLLAYVI